MTVKTVFTHAWRWPLAGAIAAAAVGLAACGGGSSGVQGLLMLGYEPEI